MRPPPTSAKRIRGRLTVAVAPGRRPARAGAGEPEERSVPPRTSPNGTVLLHLGPDTRPTPSGPASDDNV